MIREFDSSETSSTVKSARYDTDTQILEIYFKSGFGYAYSNVPEEKYAEFEQADSKGRALNALFYKQHDYVKLNTGVA